jgi:hypothetical protein
LPYCSINSRISCFASFEVQRVRELRFAGLPHRISGNQQDAATVSKIGGAGAR